MIWRKREAFSSNVCHSERFWGFLKAYLENGDVWIWVWGFYKNYEAFWRHSQKNGGFNKNSEVLTKITRLFEDIFNRIEAFCDVRLFQRIRDFLKLFPDKWRVFSLL
jgi:hypothetical protein